MVPLKFLLFTVISLACATLTSNHENDTDKAIEKVFEIEKLDEDSFYAILEIWGPHRTLSLRILSRGIYHRIRKLWPRMELGVNLQPCSSRKSIDFSHIVKITEMNLPDEEFFYNKGQLSCVRKFSIVSSSIPNLQAMINLLPRRWLTSLTLQIDSSTKPVIYQLNFPNLNCLNLCGPAIRLSSEAFLSLPNCMEELNLELVQIDDDSLAQALKSMTRLRVLSIRNCSLSQSTLFSIIGNLPASLINLGISHNIFLNYDNSLINGLGNLNSLGLLQKIDICDINAGLAANIILNLPTSISEISCFSGNNHKEIFNALKTQSKKLPNIKVIDPIFDETTMRATLELFPSLNEQTRKLFEYYNGDD